MFEITYKFKKQISPGVYEEEIESKTVKVGQAYEDTPLEAAAGKIIAQLARRNILVVEVEAYEYRKKQINVKLVDDGVVIKNKRYIFNISYAKGR